MFFFFLTVPLFGMLLCLPLHAAGSGEKLFLTRDGQPAAVIVVADIPLDASDVRGHQTLTQMTAAEELQKYIEQASGAKLPIVGAAGVPETGTLLLVGVSALSKKYNLEPPDRSEGLLIASFPRGLAILGEVAAADVPENNTYKDFDRGIMHAVYTFLEEYVGYRFYFENRNDDQMGMVVPSKPTISLTLPIRYEDAPFFSMRDIGEIAADRAGVSDGIQAGHTHSGWARLYKESHPEFFALKADGTRNWNYLCYTEPGVLEAELRHIKEWYENGTLLTATRPTRRFIPVWPDDNAGSLCSCDRCNNLKTPKRGYPGSVSNLWFNYVKRLAGRVAELWPGKRVLTGAYTQWTYPPEFELPDNIDIQLCLVPSPNGRYSTTLLIKQPEVYKANLELVREWSINLQNNPDRLHIREYFSPVPCNHTGMPALFPHVLQRWIQDMRTLTRGSYFDGLGGLPRTPGNYLMMWLWGRLLWNPSLDVDAEVKKHCLDFFGPGGKAMLDFYRLLIEGDEKPFPSDEFRAVSSSHGYPSGDYNIQMLFQHSYPPEVLDRLEGYLHDALQAAGLPKAPNWEVNHNMAWTLRNSGEVPCTYPVTFTPVSGAMLWPRVYWEDGELTYKGELKTGQRLFIEKGPRATLFVENGSASDVTEKIRGGLPVVAPCTTVVMQYASRSADDRDIMRVTLGEGAFDEKHLNIYQKRLLWIRRYFEVHTKGLGRYTSPTGPFVLGRLTQQWTQRGIPAYHVTWTEQAPPADFDSDCWGKTETISLVEGSPDPQNADTNVGFQPALPTYVRMLQDKENLYLAFRNIQWEKPLNDETDGVIVRMYRGRTAVGDPLNPQNNAVVEIAVRPDGTLYQTPPSFPYRRTNFGLGSEGISVQARSNGFPETYRVTVKPSQSATIRLDTLRNYTGTRHIIGGVYSYRYPSGGNGWHEGYLQFDIPGLNPGEKIARAVLHGYIDRLFGSYTLPIQVGYSPDDDWDGKAEVFERRLTLEDTFTALGRYDAKGSYPELWFESDVSRYLRMEGEGPGHRLTIGITGGRHQGLRGFTMRIDEGVYAPYLELEIVKETVETEPRWDVVITIPKNKISPDGNITELWAQLVRIHQYRYHSHQRQRVGSYLQWKPDLMNIWHFWEPQKKNLTSTGKILFTVK